jgi:hypothetical protein
MQSELTGICFASFYPNPSHARKGIAMNIFETILDKLGIHKPAAPAAGAGSASASAGSAPAAPAGGGGLAAGVRAAGVPMVDVMSKLDKLSGNSGLDWKVSIVDLLKLLNMDSSLNARKQLATELGCPPNLMGGDSAKMNEWLHKTVLQKIAENGGNIPQSLLH